MEVIAQLRGLRMSPRKVRYVANVIRRMDVALAETQLKFINKAASKPLLKLLLSAVANAEHNFKLDRSKLWICHLTVDGGPTLKRWRSRAFGRAAPIRKRTAHIVIKLTDEAKPAIKVKKAYVPRRAKIARQTPKASANKAEVAN